MKMFAIATAAIGLAVTTTPAFAGSSSDEGTMQIQFDDLNLDTPSGQKQLDRRLDRAARSVCGLDAARTTTRIKDNSARECYEKALASAKSQVATIIEEQQRGG